MKISLKEKLNSFKERPAPNIIIGILLIIVLILISIIIINPKVPIISEKLIHRIRQNDTILQVDYLYVGQGDATLIRDIRPDGKVMLIDGGPSDMVDDFSGEFDSGRDTILPFLDAEGIGYIDYIVASHKDADHIGGLSYVISNVEVGTVFDNGREHSSPFAKNFLDSVANDPSIKYIIPYAGMDIRFADDISCQVIAPLRNYDETIRVENNTSIVIRFVINNISFIFPGDIEIPAELDLLEYGESIRTTVLKVPHHGSDSSSSKPFLDKIRPEVAVFSAGRFNKFGFPVFEIIRRYEEYGTEIFRTDFDGNIRIITDGINYKVITER